MEQQKSKSEILREWVRGKLDNNYDYSTKLNRTHDFTEFINSHKDDGFDIKGHKPLYHAILKKEIVNKGFNPRTFGLTPQRPTFPHSDMSGKITPVQVRPFIPYRERPVQDKANEKARSENDKEISQDESTNQTILNYDVRSVGMLAKGLYGGLRIKYPEIANLTDEEIEILGETWLPFAQKHLQKDMMIYVTPIITTLSIIVPKLQKVRSEQRKEEKILEMK